MSYIVEENEFQRDQQHMDAGTLRNKIGRRGHYSVCPKTDPEHSQMVTEWREHGEVWDGSKWSPISEHLKP